MIKLILKGIIIFIFGWIIGSFILAGGLHFCLGDPWIGFKKAFLNGLIVGVANFLCIVPIYLIKGRY